MNLSEPLDRHARERPDHPVLLDGPRTITYSQFHAAVLRLSAKLNQAGVKRGDRAAIAMPDSLAFLASVYALARIGATIMPLSPDLAAPECESMVRDHGVAVVLRQPDGPRIPDVPSIDVAPDEDAIGEIPRSIPDAADDAGDLPFELSFSSGTTGQPKAFLVTQAQQRRRYRVFNELGFGAETRYLAVISLYFNMGLRCAMAVIEQGGTVVLKHDLSNVEQLEELCARHDVTATYIMPAHLRSLSAIARPDALLLPSVQCLLIGGAPLSPYDRRFARARVSEGFHEIYGANEVGVITMSTAADQLRFPDSLGRVADSADLEIVSPDGSAAPHGTEGLVRFRHSGMVDGYLNNEAATRQSFRNGWFHPGDVATMNKEGYVFFHGRADDVINVDGTKFYPSETEDALLQHPNVAEAAVVATPWHDDRTLVQAFVVVSKPTETDALLAFCRERISLYKVPNRLVVLNEMPRTHNGKIAKRRLPVADASGEEIIGLRTPFETS